MLASKQSVAASRTAFSRGGRVAPRLRLHVVAAKGGEEGGKTFDKSVVGVASANANFALLASCIGKVGYRAFPCWWQGSLQGVVEL